MDNFQPPVPGKLTTAIVICCYSDKRWDVLNKAMEAATRQVPAADEIVVIVDHNPALALRLRAKRFETPVRIVENIHPPGLSGARNTGISASRGEVILFLDDDAVSDRDLLATLVRQLEDPSVLGAVSAIRPLWETDRPSWFPDEFLWTLGCTYRGLHPGPVRNLIGASMCIRRSVFDHTGGFDSAWAERPRLCRSDARKPNSASVQPRPCRMAVSSSSRPAAAITPYPLIVRRGNISFIDAGPKGFQRPAYR